MFFLTMFFFVITTVFFFMTFIALRVIFPAFGTMLCMHFMTPVHSLLVDFLAFFTRAGFISGLLIGLKIFAILANILIILTDALIILTDILVIVVDNMIIATDLASILVDIAVIGCRIGNRRGQAERSDERQSGNLVHSAIPYS